MARLNIADKVTGTPLPDVNEDRKFTAGDCNKIKAAINGIDTEVTDLTTKVGEFETQGDDREQEILGVRRTVQTLTDRLAEAEGGFNANTELINSNSEKLRLLLLRWGDLNNKINNLQSTGGDHDLAEVKDDLDTLKEDLDAEISRVESNLRRAETTLARIGRTTHYQEISNDLPDGGNVTIFLNVPGIYLFHGDHDLTVRIPNALGGVLEFRTEARATLSFSGRFAPELRKKMYQRSQPLFLRWVERNYLNVGDEPNGSHGVYLY